MLSTVPGLAGLMAALTATEAGRVPWDSCGQEAEPEEVGGEWIRMESRMMLTALFYSVLF